MGIYLELVDFDELFNSQEGEATTVVDYDGLASNRFFKSNATAKLVVNDLSDSSIEEKEQINRNIYTRYNNDSMIDNVPSCDYGCSVGQFNIGTICESCGTEVVARYETEIKPLIWMKAPNGIPAFINPIAWTILSDRFRGPNRFDTLRWLTDTTYSAPNGRPVVLDLLESLKIPRGMTNFFNNFDSIMETLFGIRALQKGTSRSVDEVREFVIRNRSKIFCRYLPLPNKLLLVVEETNYGTFMDANITGIVDALWLMVGIDSDVVGLKQRQKENRTIKANVSIADFYKENLKKSFMDKTGIFRGHLFGTRSAWSFRTVVSSNTDAHRYDEIHIPWGVGVEIFKYQLINKLFRRGFKPKEITAKLTNHALRFCPVLAELFEEIIGEYHHRWIGVPTIAIRNPSLMRGSAQRVFITKVKSDPRDITTTISILIVKTWNADKHLSSLRVIAMGVSLIDGNGLRALYTNYDWETIIGLV